MSVATDGTQGDQYSELPALTADGRYVAFVSWATNLTPGDSNGAADVFVKDRQTGALERVSVAADGDQANAASGERTSGALARPNMSTSPRAGNPKGTSVQTRDTGLLSLRPGLSADGQYVAFTTSASNLTLGDANARDDVLVKDRLDGGIERISVAADGSDADAASSYAALSADGRYVAFASPARNLVAGDTNERWEVFVAERGHP